MDYSFNGYRRPNGKIGARNLVAVIPSVICANDIAQAVCRQVQGTIGFFHHQGCCQLPIDLKRVTDTLISLGSSPNVGASLIVSLGCEGTDTERLFASLKETGKPVEIVRIQELGGTSRAIQAGIDEAQKLALAISGQQREKASIDEVVMSIKCGASDATSAWRPTA
jgi:altronate dehydratase large subunit